jgi:hypothetical protein
MGNYLDEVVGGGGVNDSRESRWKKGWMLKERMMACNPPEMGSHDLFGARSMLALV